ncbi:alpha/beta hydrolase [Frigoribacterium sp. Leaf172]|uniref:alpha/beta hydrolase n=1 Tax=Frigoribacterium sp. Leaf172 TaxID=1736285 RepID=UPI0007005382|nr:alpha/beta hydrolase [Frigoribacterium sp. Leaf172]KQR65694.1 hypothetical protein ASF89_00365 [Frigoribacterium sp. Leaf172]
MATIEFDDGAADALIAAADGASSDLRTQAMSNRMQVESVVPDFQGAYATLFTQASTVRSEDTQKLAGVLSDLSGAVGTAKQEAERERQRLRDVDSWTTRETARDEQRASGDFLQGASAFATSLTDPRPSDVAVKPKPIAASFIARVRNRTSGGSSGGMSSADPDLLRTFAAASRASDLSSAQHVIQMKNAWAGFTSACSWVPIDSSTAISSLDVLMTENAADATWLDGIAAAFEEAGGGSLPDLSLDSVAVTSASPALTRLLQPGLTPAEVAEAYAQLPQTDAYISGLPLATQYLFANLDGVPASKRDIASRAVLDAAVEDPERVYQLMGLGGDRNRGLDGFKEDVVALQKAVKEADITAAQLRADSGTTSVAQLVGFGEHDGAVVAAISLGDLDSASNVTVNVPGMNSNVGEMNTAVTAANQLIRAARETDSDASYAVVSWMGYNSPNPAEVGLPARASSGAAELASFMDGLHDSRDDGSADSVTLMAHSYGSTTSSAALLLTEHRIDSFISYGSVGLTNEATVDELNADEVYATQAWGDGLAPVGLALGLGTRTNPLIVDGVHVFSAEDGPGTEAVTKHDMFVESGSDQNGYLSADSTSLKTISQIVANGRPD